MEIKNILFFIQNGFDKIKTYVHNAPLFQEGLPQRSTGPDCKSGGLAFEGSNPSPSTINTVLRVKIVWSVPCADKVGGAGVAQW